MPLHPQAAAFLEYAAASGMPALHMLSPEDARAAVDGGEAIGPGPAVDAVYDVSISVRDGEIAGRIYRPAGAEAVIVWLHGGVWVVGGLDSHDAMCRMLANHASATVVNVAYRRAPEHRFPVALEDAWDTLAWAAAQWPGAPLIVGGDSAGGNLAAVCALRAQQRGGPDLVAQVLVYPIVDHDMTNGSYQECWERRTWRGALTITFPSPETATIPTSRRYVLRISSVCRARSSCSTSTTHCATRALPTLSVFARTAWRYDCISTRTCPTCSSSSSTCSIEATRRSARSVVTYGR